MTNKTIRKLLFAVAGCVFLISSLVVSKHSLEMRDSAVFTESIAEMVVTPSVALPEPAKSAPVTPIPTKSSDKTTIEEPPVSVPIQIDFDTLCNKNQDVVAWIYCPDTPINYPIVQASDNEYYLRRLLDGSYNTAGTLFIDYRNAADLSDWNSIIYGHNLKHEAMFGSLPNYEAQSYYEAHPQLFLLTPEHDYVIELLAGFTTSADDEIYNGFSADKDARTRLLQSWLNSSDFISNIEYTAEQQLITLSTCSYQYHTAR